MSRTAPREEMKWIRKLKNKTNKVVHFFFEVVPFHEKWERQSRSPMDCAGFVGPGSSRFHDDVISATDVEIVIQFNVATIDLQISISGM